MGKVLIAGSGGGGGVGSDDTTAVKGDVLKGKTFVGKDTGDEVGTGTLELTGSSTAGDVLEGKTFYTTNPKSKLTGTMPNRGTNKPATSIGINDNGLYYYISEGYYADRANTAYKPWVYAPLESVRNALGLAASKIANGVTLAGVTGTYKGLGNAGTGDVMAGKKFSTASLSNATGTIVDRGSVSHSLPINGSYTIPAGRHSGSGRVTQSVAVQGAQTITPGTSNKTIAANRWLSGAQTIAGDTDLIASNIRKGKTIFGVAGTLMVNSGVSVFYNSGQESHTTFGVSTVRPSNNGSSSARKNSSNVYLYALGYASEVVLYRGIMSSDGYVDLTTYTKLIVTADVTMRISMDGDWANYFKIEVANQSGTIVGSALVYGNAANFNGQSYNLQLNISNISGANRIIVSANSSFGGHPCTLYVRKIWIE